jgi:hypothetical protein
MGTMRKPLFMYPTHSEDNRGIPKRPVKWRAAHDHIAGNGATYSTRG